MSDQLRTIRLYGVLGAKFGRVFRLAVSSPAEAIRALCQLLPGFEAYMVQSKDQGLGFAVFTGKRNITKEELRNPSGQDEIRIAPMIMGSKKQGIFQVIIGVILIVVGYWLGNQQLIGLGISMVIGGVVQLLSPQPKPPGTSDSPENTPSDSFNGAINTQAQGNPIPILYGELIVGSAVISAGLYSEDVYIPAEPDPDPEPGFPGDPFIHLPT